MKRSRTTAPAGAVSSHSHASSSFRPLEYSADAAEPSVKVAGVAPADSSVRPEHVRTLTYSASKPVREIEISDVKRTSIVRAVDVSVSALDVSVAGKAVPEIWPKDTADGLEPS